MVQRKMDKQTDNTSTMTKRKKNKKTKNNPQTLNRKQKTEQHKPPLETGRAFRCSRSESSSCFTVTSAMLLLLNIR
jgi:hypothetical protein